MEEEQRTYQVEEGEQEEMDRHWERKTSEEEKVGRQSRGEVGEPQNQGVVEGEEVQEEGRGLDGRWVG